MPPSPDPLAAITPSQSQPSLLDQFTAAVAARRRTVWDARRFLAAHRGRVIELGLDDGQYADARRYAVYENLIHTPKLGFALVVRGLSARPDGPAGHHARQRVTLPISLLRQLPPDFAFLRDPPGTWPMPPALVACPQAGCAYPHNTGRFCLRCGKLVRRGPAGQVLGEGFAVMQRLLRERAAEQPGRTVACRCGAVVATDDRYCPKCGVAVHVLTSG